MYSYLEWTTRVSTGTNVTIIWLIHEYDDAALLFITHTVLWFRWQI